MKKIMTILTILLLSISTNIYAQELVDSGISYIDAKDFISRDNNEYVCKNASYCMKDALIMNPERGFYSTNQLVLYQDDSKNQAKDISSWTGSLLYLSVDLSDFSGAYHLNSDGSLGDDEELTESALNTLDETIKNIKSHNRQVILRFVYDRYSDGIKDNEGYHNGDTVIVEPRQNMIIKHIEQLSKVLNDNQEVIYTVQIGFYGSYGELHSSSMCTSDNINDALSKLLECTKDIFVSVRTPSRYAYYKGLDINNIDNDESSISENAYRIAIFNDGYLGSDSDLGTYHDRAKELIWLNKQSRHTPYGGEAVVNITPDSDGNLSIMGNMSSKDNVLYEMPLTHTSYLNYEWRQELHNEWAKTIYDRNDEYLNDNLLKYIEYHLGYRFVFRDIKLYDEVPKGSNLDIVLKIENVGFGNVIKDKEAYIIIADDDNNVYMYERIDNDIKKYTSDIISNDKISINIPKNLENNEYRVFLQFRISGDEMFNTYGSIRFANPDIWYENYQANYIGSFKVVDEVVTPIIESKPTIIEEIVNVPPTGKKMIVSTIIGIIMFIIGISYLVRLKKDV